MKNLMDKKILYIICGGISAYKSLETIRLFKKNGAEIKTILTNSAKEFITPLSVASLSQGKVYSDLFSIENETEMDHIALSRWADVILIAPATANTISKLAQGTTDDLASTVVLASNKEIYLAPAMNVRMWEHQSTKQNLKKLINYGYKLIGPEIGEMACGEYGEGKMSDPDKISNEINNYFSNLKKNKKKYFRDVIYPLNRFTDTRNISNLRKIIQVQFSIPKSKEDELENLLSLLVVGQVPLMCSVKRLRAKEDGINLSFVQDGWTAAIDFSEREFNHKSIRIFYSELIKHGGKIYLGKDSTLNVSEFNDMYPDLDAWKKVVKEIDRNNLFQSSLSKRLNIK